MKRVKIEHSVLTSAGGRTQNEDCARIAVAGTEIVAVVADGLGGQGGGKTASEAAAMAFVRYAEERGCGTRSGILEAVNCANRAVLDAQADGSRMMTTLVSLIIKDDEAVWAYVGDSRLYYFRDEKLVCQTLDHSVSQLAVFMKMITPDQIRFHEDRCRILRALGSDDSRPEISDPVRLDGGKNSFLLCTDGFWEYVLEEEMQKTLKESGSPEEWLRKMEEILKGCAPADQDNYTAVALFANEEV